MNRREFVSTLALAGFARGAAVRSPALDRYGALLRVVDPGGDGFACEREARVIEGHLAELLQTRSLPVGAEFRGASPLPVRYRAVAQGVERAEFAGGDWVEGLRAWVVSLGQVRWSRFYALADHVVRYEIAGQGEYRVGHWRQVWHDGKLAEARPLDETRVRAAEPLFTDVTAHCLGGSESFQAQLLGGNPWWRARMDAATGIDIYGNNGIAVADVDGDGQDEIYVCQPGGLLNRLYRVRADGAFEDVTERSGLGVLDETTCALFLDLRNSGAQDAVLLRASGPLLFRNDGSGRFTPQPDAFRFSTQPQGSFTGMAAADYDRDGKLDLYLCCYIYFQSEDQYRYPVPYHDAQNGPPNFLMRNRLDADGGFFEDVTAAVGLNQNNNRYSFAPAWCDFDGDGWPDLYVANDFGRNNLYRNRDGKFRDEAAESGIDDVGPGMSAAWFDYDGDGRPDLYVSNMWTAPGQRVVNDPAFLPGAQAREAFPGHTKGNSLYRNLGGGKFEQVEDREGVGMGRWAWSADGFDFDNDGSPEVYITAGMLTNGGESDLSSFFWRQVVAKSPVKFQPAPEYENGWNALNELIREDHSWCGREPNVFYRRVRPAEGEAARFYDFSGVSGLDFAEDSRAFAVTDVDGDGSLDIVLKSRLGPQVRVLRNNCGAGRPVLAVRLRGTKSNRDGIGARVEVDGRVQFVAAGSGFLSQHSKTLHFGLRGESGDVRITWPSGLVETHAGLKAGSRYEFTEGVAEAKAVAFRARADWRAGAVAGRNTPEKADVWLVEPVPTPERIPKPGFVLLFSGERPAWPGGVPVQAVDLGRSPAETGAGYSLLRRYLLEYRKELELPAVLLVDDLSRVVKLYGAVPSAETAAADLKRMADPERAQLAFPFRGVSFGTPSRNYFKLGAAFYWAGYPEKALPYVEEELRRNPQNWKGWNAAARIHFEGGRYQEALGGYRKALAIRPEYAGALLGAGEAAVKLGDVAEAERFLRAALNDANASADAANQLGLLRVKQNNPEDAKRWFEKAIAARRDHSGAINNLGVLYMQLGQSNDAIAAFEFGIQQAPDDGQLYLNLGRVFVALGQTERAKETMHRLLTRKPGDPTATKALAALSGR